MAKANAETRTTALLFSFSAVVFVLLARAVLLQPRDRSPGGALADLLLAAANGLDRFLDGRGLLLHLATRRNMVLFCHAILLVILRDAGVLGAPARRRRDATAAPVMTHAAEPERSIVVWRRPRGSAKDDARADGSGRRLVRRRSAQQHPAAAAAPIPCAAPALAEQPEHHQTPPLTTKEIVLVEKAPRNYLLEDHDRDAAVVDLRLTSASDADGNKSGFGRGIVVVAGDERDVDTAAEETPPELADDRRIEEFIAKQWSKMRQEMQLEMSSSGSQKAITAC